MTYPMRTFFTLVLALALTSAGARDWTAYMSYHNCTHNIHASGRVYALTNGSIFTYRFGDAQVSTFSKPSGLSSTNIKMMSYNETEDAFLLVYTDNRMDVLGTNDSITRMPEYRNSNVSDKTVNAISMVGKNAYVATNSGVMVINMARREISNFYEFSSPVRGCAATGKIIVALLADGNVYGGETSKNLLDKSNWTVLVKNVTYTGLTNYKDYIYMWNSSSIYRLNDNLNGLVRVQIARYSYFNFTGDDIIVGNASQVVFLDEDGVQKTIDIPNDFKYLDYDGEYYWASRGAAGLQPYTLRNDSLVPAASPVVPNSPVRNFTYWVTYAPNERLLIGGGSHNYEGINYDGTVMTYQDKLWTNFGEDSIAIKTGQPYRNITAVAQDPLNPEHHFASSAGMGIYEFLNGRFVRQYDCDNSPLSTILPDIPNYRRYVRISGLNFDSEGNLWMFNNEVDTVLRVRQADGRWRAFYFGSLAGYPTFDKIIFDRRGWLWGTHRRGTASHNAGVLCLDYGGTLNTRTDDRWRFHNKFTNQDNTEYTFSLLYDVAEDMNGQIWVGTERGPFLLTDPTSFFNDSPVFTQVKVPRNDGTNYADYLLADVPVTAIAIDGGNRKWFGTANQGVYLVSADGLVTIHHFTAENSPLLSNVIYDIAINGQTGEVMIGTDAGLIGYRADATDPQTELKESNLLIYPNPVRPEFQGNLRVDGLVFDSDVKITTATGQLVAQGTSVGGTFTWNLRDLRGRRVNTGVYYIIASDANGKEGVAGKFVVVK